MKNPDPRASSAASYHTQTTFRCLMQPQPQRQDKPAVEIEVDSAPLTDLLEEVVSSTQEAADKRRERRREAAQRRVEKRIREIKERLRGAPCSRCGGYH